MSDQKPHSTWGKMWHQFVSWFMNKPEPQPVDQNRPLEVAYTIGHNGDFSTLQELNEYWSKQDLCKQNVRIIVKLVEEPITICGVPMPLPPPTYMIVRKQAQVPKLLQDEPQ